MCELKVKVGGIEIDETTLKLMLHSYILVEQAMSNALLIDAIAKKVGVSRGKIVKALNLMDRIVMDAFTFSMYETMLGRVKEEDFNLLIDCTIKKVKKVSQDRSVAKSFGFQLMMINMLAEVSTIKRMGEINRRLGVSMGAGYENVRRAWERDFAQLMLKLESVLKKMMRGKNGDINAFSEAVKYYVE